MNAKQPRLRAISRQPDVPSWTSAEQPRWLAISKQPGVLSFACPIDSKRSGVLSPGKHAKPPAAEMPFTHIHQLPGSTSSPRPSQLLSVPSKDTRDARRAALRGTWGSNNKSGRHRGADETDRSQQLQCESLMCNAQIPRSTVIVGKQQSTLNVRINKKWKQRQKKAPS